MDDEYVVFDSEGHGFTKKENEIKGDQAILEFLDKHLRVSATTAKIAAQIGLAVDSIDAAILAASFTCA